MRAVHIVLIVYQIYGLPYLTQGDGYSGGGGYSGNGGYSGGGGYSDHSNQAGGYSQNQIDQSSGHSGYRYTTPRIAFRYPEEFENKYNNRYDDSKRDRTRLEERTTTERASTRDRDREDEDRKRLQDREDRERENDRNDRKRVEDALREKNKKKDDERRQQEREDEQADKLKLGEIKLKEKVKELEEREERISRQRKELEIMKKREQAMRQALVDQLVAEYRNTSLKELTRFGENLLKNQRLEDEARDAALPESERRFQFTEEREEIIRKGGQTPIINRSKNITVGVVPTGDDTLEGSSRFASESSFSKSTTGGEADNRRPTNPSDRDNSNSGQSESSRSSSSRSSSSRQSSRGNVGGARGTLDDDDSSGGSENSRSSSSRSSSSRQSSRGSGGTGSALDDDDFSGGSGVSGNSGSSASRSSSSSSRSSSSGSGSLDSASSGSFLFPVRQIFNDFSTGSLNSPRKFIPPIANDPVFLSIASRDEVLERTGASRSFSKQFNACPAGSVYSFAQKRCIRWG